MNNLIKQMIENEKIEQKTEKIESLNKEEIIRSDKYELMSIDEYMGKEKPPKEDFIIIIQDGGLGDTISSTVMIESARIKYFDKKIIFGTYYPEIYLNNPNVDILFASFDGEEIYNTWVKKIRYNSSLLKKDIYNSGVHKIFPGKLSEAYCYYYNVPFYGDFPKVYLTEDEINEAKKFLSSFPKDVILIHPYGGKKNSDPKVKLTNNKDWFKEYWEKLTSMLNEEFDIIQVGGYFEEKINGVTTYLMGGTSIRQTMALVKESLTFIAVDSFISHVGPAVGKAGVVMYGRSNPFIFGHDLNVNIWVENSCKLNDMFCGRPQSYWGDRELFKGMKRLWECPHRSCMKAITPEMVFKKVFEAIERNTK